MIVLYTTCILCELKSSEMLKAFLDDFSALVSTMCSFILDETVNGHVRILAVSLSYITLT